MSMGHTYEIWVLGYNDDDIVNDYEELIGSFPREDIAKDIFYGYCGEMPKPDYTPKAKLVLEEVEFDKKGNGSCVNVIAETEL